MTNRFKKTVDILVDAVNEGTLSKGDCGACAVGNIARGFGSENPAAWKPLFATNVYGEQLLRDKSVNDELVNYIILGEALESIKPIPYSEDQLAQIEFAFETNTDILYIDYYAYTPKEIRIDQMKGLRAVVNLLCEFDKDSTTDIEEVFTSRVLELKN